MNASRTARDRARAELISEITAAARRQLAETGPAALSMRAVSRELGMVSSALHRYFPTRDDLLTALIVQSYDDLGAALERAVDGVGDPIERWWAAARAIRTWALANPHEYGLIYGTPVPGYRAPADTIRSAGRSIAVLAALLTDAHAAGRLHAAATSSDPSGDAARLREALQTPDLPDAAVLGGITAWAGLFGHVSFELFGQFDNVMEQRTEAFDAAVQRLGRVTGLDI